MTVEPNLIAIIELTQTALCRLACQDYEDVVHILTQIRTYATQVQEAMAQSGKDEDHPPDDSA